MSNSYKQADKCWHVPDYWMTWSCACTQAGVTSHYIYSCQPVLEDYQDFTSRIRSIYSIISCIMYIISSDIYSISRLCSLISPNSNWYGPHKLTYHLCLKIFNKCTSEKWFVILSKAIGDGAPCILPVIEFMHYILLTTWKRNCDPNCACALLSTGNVLPYAIKIL